ncbi:VOC family protein [Streptomyces oceani]|uniref:VOC domain-containing protein n=1 Tax=Streptomyces oceani TaxID=1075402 RepID=A0A1E7KKU7_9ACTN|nr:VOC family protein [Streptomyces oceani]OEV04510.1 hypothetical protein AN216_06220 [Streptomyces oceani]
MAKSIFVNLPVRDLARSRDFFSKLGFSFNEQFSSEEAASLVIDGENGIYAMLLVESYFQSFTGRDIPDTSKSCEAITCLGLDSRQEVDDIADRALAAGGQGPTEAKDHGFMYGRHFDDPDGHRWELVWMNPEGQG